MFPQHPNKNPPVDLVKLAIRLTIVFAFLANSIDIEATNLSDGIKIGFNYGALIKAMFVGAAGVLGAWGWWRFLAVRTLFATPIGFLAASLGILYFATLPISIHPAVSFVAGVAYCSYLLFFITAVVVLGAQRVLEDAIRGLLLLICVAWISYFFVPSVGVFIEYAGAEGDVLRMTGLAHPNAFAANAALFVVLTVAAFQTSADSKTRWLYLAYAFVGLAALVATLSRTALIALLIALAIANRRLFMHRLVFVGCCVAAVLAVFAVLYVDNEVGLDRIAEELLVLASKTKDADEITSATGRTDIWAYAVKLIRRSPIFGYGANTSPILMKDHSFQTHNIILAPTLNFGIPGGLIMVCWLSLNLYWAFVSKVRFVTGVCVYICISGIAEDTVLSTFPEPAMMAWFVVSFWPYLDYSTARSSETRSVQSPQPA